MTGSDEVLFELRAPAAMVTLNRPKAFNALTLNMIREIAPRLDSWRNDPQVRAVLVRGAGDRAFCAGGDIVAIYQAGKSAFAEAFFREEYRLNRSIAAYPKPYIAVIDGVTMGGGVGLSVHGRFRIATERTMMAMPEAGIGFFPDVGGTYFLPRLPGQLGLFLGLTGWRLKGADCLYAGIATHYLESASLVDLEKALVEADLSNGEAGVRAVLDGFTADPGLAPLAELRDGIDRCFSGDTLEGVIVALEVEPGDWAAKALAMIHKGSPTSLQITFRQIRAGASLSFDEAMILEYRLSQAFLSGPDFFEGIRAAVIEKDQAPRWRPDTLSAVSPETTEAYFRSLGDGDLTFQTNDG